MFRLVRETPAGVVPTNESFPTLSDAQDAADWHNEFAEVESLRERYAVTYPGE